MDQYKSLLITSVSMTNNKVLLSKLSLTRLIWHSLLMQDETNLEMCSSYDRYESKLSPISLADRTGFIIFFKKVKSHFYG